MNEESGELVLAHQTVLLHELVDSVFNCEDGYYVDVTGGFGGHSESLLKKLTSKGSLLVLDCDPKAVDLLKVKFANEPRVRVLCKPFSSLKNTLKELEISFVNGVMADLGFSSVQLDDPGRGISFMHNGPLDMRLSSLYPKTALDVLVESSVEELEEIIRNYGEEKHASLLARKIKESEDVLKTTEDLCGLCERVVGRFYRGQKIHPATRLFQALRIAVNSELEQLDCLLESIPDVLASGGRAGIISFHSLEDRKVKHCFRRLAEGDFKVLTKRAIKPSLEEIESNKRSRSAKLRVIEKL